MLNARTKENSADDAVTCAALATMTVAGGREALLMVLLAGIAMRLTVLTVLFHSGGVVGLVLVVVDAGGGAAVEVSDVAAGDAGDAASHAGNVVAAGTSCTNSISGITNNRH